MLLGNLVEDDLSARNVGDKSLSNYNKTALELFRKNVNNFLRNPKLTSHGVLLVERLIMSRVPLMSSAVFAMLNDENLMTLHDYLYRVVLFLECLFWLSSKLP